MFPDDSALVGCRPVAAALALPTGQILIATADAPVQAPAPSTLPAIEPPPAIAPPLWCPNTKDKGLASDCPGAGPPCPVGQITDAAGLVGCAPIAGASSDCPTAFVAASGGAGGPPPACLPDAATCATDPFGGVPEAPGTFFVDAKAAAGGDGSRAKPFGTLSAAVKAAPAGGVVGIADGTYAESVLLTKSLSVRGRCAAKVRLLGDAVHRTVETEGASTVVSMEGITVEGGMYGIYVDDGSHVKLTAVRIRKALKGGLWITDGAHAKASGLVVEATLGSKGAYGRGIQIDKGGRLELDGGRVSGNHEYGVSATGEGVELVASELIIDNTLARGSDGKYGYGLRIGDGAHAWLTGVRITGNRTTGVRVSGVGSLLDARYLRVDGTSEQISDASDGRGLVITDRAEVKLRHARIDGNRDRGVLVDGVGTSLWAANLMVSGTLGRASDEKHGEGIEVTNEAAMTATHLYVDGNRSVGLVVAKQAILDVQRVTITATAPQLSDGSGGRGLQARDGAQVVAKDLRIDGCHNAGLMVEDVGTTVTVKGLHVHATADSGGEAGEGVVVRSGAKATLSNAMVWQNHEVGVLVRDDGSVLKLSAALVGDTAARTSDGLRGRGVEVRGGARLEFDDVRLSGNREVGLMVRDPSSIAAGKSLRIDGTLARENDGLLGRGAMAYKGGRIQVETARISANHDIGLGADEPGSQVVAVDLVIDATAARASDKLGGRGISITDGASADLSRLRLTANREIGLFVDGGATVVAVAHLLIDGMLATVAGDTGGRAVVVQHGAKLWLRSGRFIAAREVGITVRNPGTKALISDLRVEDTRASDVGPGLGRAVDVEDGADLEMVGVTLVDSADTTIVVKGATLAAFGVDVRRTTWHVSPGGAGLAAVDGSAVQLSGARLADTRVAGVLLSKSTGSVERTVIATVQPLGGPAPDGAQAAQPADSVAVLECTGVEIKRSLLLDGARSGVFASENSGMVIERARVRGGMNGIATGKGDPPAVVGCLFGDQTDAAQAFVWSFAPPPLPSAAGGFTKDSASGL